MKVSELPSEATVVSAEVREGLAYLICTLEPEYEKKLVDRIVAALVKELHNGN